jgi:signal transduction histidine kinase/CheY-like chemotaxis protein
MASNGLHEIASLTRSMSATLDLEAVLRGVVSAVTALRTELLAGIRLMDADAGGYRLAAVGGITTERPDPLLRFGEGLAHVVAETRRPLIQDVREHPRATHRDWYAAHGLTVYCGVPIAAGAELLGVLEVHFRTGVPPSGGEQELLSTLVELAAVAIRNARLFSESERDRHAAEALLSVSRAIGSTLDVQEVIRRTTREMVRSLDADMGGAWRLSASGDELIPVAGYHIPKDLVDTYSQNPFLMKEVPQVQEPIWASDSQADPRFHHPLARLLPHRSVLIVPMWLKEQTVGGFVLVWVRGMHRFTPEEVRLAEGIARQAAVALENARLHQELRQAHEQLERNQSHLVRTERLRALGQMAAGVAHDFNNLLTAIVGRAEILLSQASTPQILGDLSGIRQAALDGAQTVRRIQEFTRTRESRPLVPVDVVAAVREAVELTTPRWKNEAQAHGLAYAVHVEGGRLPPVAGRPEELREVFVNLLTNSLEAMPAGGTVTFRVRADDDEVVVEAEDTGHGMSEETRARVFEPFFTTKEPRGSGLGLSVSWGIVQRHGGTIEVLSALAKGATFVVRLPVSRKPPSGDIAPPPAPAVRGSRILLIDDDEVVRSTLAELLRMEQYTVIEAANGAEGLARCESQPFDLVLTDVSMPGMSGWDVAMTCAARFPSLPVGFITGWGDQLDPGELQRRQIRFVLAKPVTKEELLRQISGFAVGGRPARRAS